MRRLKLCVALIWLEVRIYRAGRRARQRSIRPYQRQRKGNTAVTKIQITPKWSTVKPDGFYVYIHRRATDGSAFYVGKGRGKRAWRWGESRNPHWRNIASKNGVYVEIYKDNMSET